MGIRAATSNDVRDGEDAQDDRGVSAAGGQAATAGRPGGSPGGGDVRKGAPDPGTHDAASAVAPAADGSAPPAGRPVFVDTTGRRSRTWRRAGSITALCCACYATTVVVALVGGDSTAPFLQLPRAMGLEREAGEKPAVTRGEDRAVPAAEQIPSTPEPVTPGPSLPSAAGQAAVPLPLEASSGPADIPAVDAKPAAPSPGRQTSLPPSAGAAPGGTAGGEPTTEPAPPAPEPGSGSGSGTAPSDGGGAQEPEGDDGTASSGGPLGDLLGGLLGGLLGRA